jgi:hypothetical protein
MSRRIEDLHPEEQQEVTQQILTTVESVLDELESVEDEEDDDEEDYESEIEEAYREYEAKVARDANKPINIHETLDPVRTALFNMTQFNMARFRDWLMGQSPAVKAASAQCPPNRIYMYKEGFICAIYGYSRYTGRLILKTVEFDGEFRDVPPDDVRDISKELARKYGLTLPGS